MTDDMLDRNIPPQVHPMGDLVLPPLRVHTLANGVRLNVMSAGTQPATQLTVIWPGGMVEAQCREASKLAASMWLEGADGMSGTEIAEALDFNGAFLRMEVGDHHTLLTLVTVNSLSHDVMPVVKRVMLSPDFPDDLIDVYKQKEAQELMLQQARVAYQSNQAAMRLIAGADNPCSRELTVEGIMGVKRSDMVEWQRRNMRAEGCQAYLGGFVTDEVLAQVIDLLSAIPSAGEPLPLSLHPFCPEPPQRVKVEKADSQQSAVTVTLPAPPRSHPDYLPLRLTVRALGGYFGSRLMRNIREDKGYTYGIGAYLAGSLDGSAIYIAAQCDASYVEPVITEIGAEMEKMATEPLDADEMLRLRQSLAASLMETLDSPFSIVDYYKTKQLVGLADDYFSLQVELCKTFAPELIIDMTRRYLLPSQMRIAVAGR